MKVTGKLFARRPWDAGDNGLIRHFDGVHLINPGERGFYLCMHTARGFLKQSNINCESEDGFFWEGLVLENFTITGVTGGEAIYITDGKIKGMKPDLTIKSGEIVGLNDSKAAVLSHLNLGTVSICSLKTTGNISIEDCEIDKLIVRSCSNFKFDCKNSKVGSIELWQCNNIDVSAFTGVKPTLFTVAKNKENLSAAAAINVMIDGVLYGVDFKDIQLKPRSL